MLRNFVTVRWLVSLASPGGVILLAAWALQQEDVVRGAAAAYSVHFCYGALAVAALLSWYYNYVRLLSVTLVTGLAVWSFGRDVPADDVTNLATAFLLPLNFAFFAAVKERGVFTPYGFLNIGAIAAQAAAVRLLIEKGSERIERFLRWDGLAGNWTGLSWSGLLSFAVIALFLVVLVFMRRTNVDVGLLWALCAVFAGLHQIDAPGAMHFYGGAAGVILMFAVLEHGFDIAYRDELTGLPGRRAFNEFVPQLRRRYTIAMCDVDHFKAFNDSYGHDAGDRVLKMVASTLLRVHGGGRAFRYGGEEFALVFEGRTAKEAEPALEALRAAIAKMSLVPEGLERSRKKAGPRNGDAKGEDAATITISIGVADHSPDRGAPEVVLEAADAALYRAKASGRNCVKLVEDPSF
jgi:diguanylate cyclase (GGDEF)-like protein